MVLIWNEGALSFLLCLLVVNSLGGKDGVHHISNESWPLLEGVVSPFFSGVRWFKSYIDFPLLVMCHCRHGATSACVSTLR